jgi:hypothetical protein
MKMTKSEKNDCGQSHSAYYYTDRKARRCQLTMALKEMASKKPLTDSPNVDAKSWVRRIDVGSCFIHVSQP